MYSYLVLDREVMSSAVSVEASVDALEVIKRSDLHVGHFHADPSFRDALSYSCLKEIPTPGWLLDFDCWPSLHTYLHIASSATPSGYVPSGTVLDLIAASPQHTLLTAALGNASLIGPVLFSFLHTPSAGESHCIGIPVRITTPCTDSCLLVCSWTLP